MAVAISGRSLANVPLLSSGCPELLEPDRIDARRVEGIKVLQRPWMPFADLWRDVAQRRPLAAMAMCAVAAWQRSSLLCTAAPRLNWVMLLAPVATDVLSCWRELAHRVEATQQGRYPLLSGRSRSTGLSVQRLHQRSGALVMWLGRQRWQLFPSPQALWTLQDQHR